MVCSATALLGCAASAAFAGFLFGLGVFRAFLGGVLLGGILLGTLLQFFLLLGLFFLLSRCLLGLL